MSTVLVVEDDADIREALREALEAGDFDVVEVTNGREALEYLQRTDRHPCVVLLDLMMPVLDGWQLMELLRGDDRLMTIPVVVTSAQAHARPLPAGTKVLKKPVALNALIAAVVEHCGER